MVLAVLVFVAGLIAPAQPGKANAAGAQAAQGAKSNSAPSAANQEDLASTDLREIKRPPLPQFNPQEPKRIQLQNGMVIFLQEDHELPLINGVAFIRGGSKSEPAEKIGLASIYAGAWRTGGTKTKTGDQLDDELEARAARVETGGGVDTTTVRLSCLKQDFDFVLNDFIDVLRNPEFRDDKIEIAKNNVKTAIARRNDDLGQIANRESTKLGFGAQSPYARVPEYATVAAVTRQDLLDWHSKYVEPNNIILGIVGDFDPATMEAALRKQFESWPKGADYKAPQIAVTPPKPGVYFVEKSDVNQTEIRMVSLGLRRDDPDFYAVEVFNQVFGGGFSSRLFQNLRTKAGLAYAVGGGISAPFDHPGLARLIMGTKTGTTAQAIEGMYAQVDKLRTDPITPAETQRGKDAILNSFIFEFDSKEKVMQERMTYELYGYPADFLERYQKGVEKVTVEDVNRVAQKYLDKSKLAVLVVGKSAEFDKSLSAFGPVTNVDITIPSATTTATTASAPAGADKEGKALVAKVVEAAGGAEKLKSIKTVRVKATLTLKAQGLSLEAEETDVLPDKVHNRMTIPGGEMVMVTGPQESFVQGPTGTLPLPSSQREDSLNSLHRNIWYVAQHVTDPSYSFTKTGTEKVGDVEATVLDVRGGGQQWQWYIDPQTGHIVRVQYEGNGPTGPGPRIVDLSEWKPVDGITVPFHEEVTANGQPAATVAISSYEFNPTVDPKIFEKPADKPAEQK
jgi:zinc protease